MKVLKFGGTSVGSVKSILSLKHIVENEAKKQPVVAATQCAHLLEDGLLALGYHRGAFQIVPLGQVLGTLCLFVVFHAQWDALADAAHHLLAQHIGGDVGHLP